MTFTSINFLLFFPIVVILYYLIPIRYRVAYLLVVSYYFYVNMSPIYAILLAGTSIITYISGLLIERVKSDKAKQRSLILGVILVLLPLLFYKYFGQINEYLDILFQQCGISISLPHISLLLPVGISFYTFMAMGYLFDVYNEEIEAQRSIIDLSLFISFFPLILSGPIERATNIIPQLKKLNAFCYKNIADGFRLMLWGYFMKLVVADRLGLYIDAVYNNVSNHTGTTLGFASLLYPIQLYGDLGGYSLIAIGVAKCLGIDVIANFKRPFFATSMSELWRRWHISLIKWLTDYVYTPISFHYRSWKLWGIVISLMITFFISGIWHGATLCFVVWGLFQGALLSIEAVTNKQKSAFEKKYNLNKNVLYIVLGISFTYLLFAFSQIFGKATNFFQATEVISKIFTNWGSLYLDKAELGYAFIGVVLLIIKDFKDEYGWRIRLSSSSRYWIRMFYYVSIITIILLLGVLDGGSFIYFQF